MLKIISIKVIKILISFMKKKINALLFYKIINNKFKKNFINVSEKFFKQMVPIKSHENKIMNNICRISQFNILFYILL